MGLTQVFARPVKKRRAAEFSLLEKHGRRRYESAVNLSPYFKAMSASLGSQGAIRGSLAISRAGRSAAPLKGFRMSMSSSRFEFRSSFGAAVVAGALLLASAPAFAQQPAAPAPGQAPAGQAPGGQPAAPQGPLKVDLIPTQADWTKVCGHDNAANKDICYTTRDFGAQKDQAPVLALAVYDVKGEDVKIVRFLMPVGLMLRPGFRFSIDKGAVTEGGFEICFPNGCFAEAKVKKDVIDAARKGTAMTVVVKNQANAEVVFNLPLAGFGKAFDGPAVDPKVLEEQQKKLATELQKRAEEERKKLEQQQGGAAAPAAPAAPAK
jgi:invasion protein IalB